MLQFSSPLKTSVKETVTGEIIHSKECATKRKLLICISLHAREERYENLTNPADILFLPFAEFE